jgi:hypothetical protein
MKSKKIALSGILIAFTIILLMLTNYINFNKLFLYSLASLPIAIIIIEFGLKYGVIFYIASSILGAIIVPNKIIPYILFFGIYGIIKFLIEKDRNIFIELLLKLISFNLLFAIIYFAFKFFIKITIPLWIVIIAAQGVFLIYDYVYSYFIGYYNNKLRHLIIK